MPGGGGGNTTTNVTSNELPGVVDEFLKEISPVGAAAYKDSVEALRGGADQFLPSGPRPIEDFNADELAGFQGIRDVASQGGSGLLLGATGAAEGLIDSGGLNEYQTGAADIYGGYADRSAIDPTLSGYAAGDQFDNNPFRDDVINRMQADIRDSVAQQFGAAGQAWEGQHAGAVAKEITDATAPILFQSHEADIGRQLQAISDIDQNVFLGAQGQANIGQQGTENVFGAISAQPQLDAAAYEAPKALASLGALERGQAQQVSDAAYAFESLSAERQQEIYQLLAQLGLGVSPALPNQGTTTSTTTEPDDTFSQIAGIGLGTAALFL